MAGAYKHCVHAQWQTSLLHSTHKFLSSIALYTVYYAKIVTTVRGNCVKLHSTTTIIELDGSSGSLLF